MLQSSCLQVLEFQCFMNIQVITSNGIFFFFLKTLMEKYESLNSARSTIKFTLCQLLSKP